MAVHVDKFSWFDLMCMFIMYKEWGTYTLWTTHINSTYNITFIDNCIKFYEQKVKKLNVTNELIYTVLYSSKYKVSTNYQP